MPRQTESTWWATRAIAWWTGVLFAIGSACFALGALPGYLSLVGAEADGVTFFVGSIFFTSAAFLQYLQGANEGRTERWRVFVVRRHSPDWWASLVQFVGTVFFNITTLHALTVSLNNPSYDHSVWSPDIYGCICFLVASQIAFVAVEHAWWSWRPHVRAWRIAFVNLAGSVAFMASGIASFVVPDTDIVRNASMVNLGTFVGAVCFFVGALELLPERTDPST